MWTPAEEALLVALPIAATIAFLIHRYPLARAGSALDDDSRMRAIVAQRVVGGVLMLALPLAAFLLVPRLTGVPLEVRSGLSPDQPLRILAGAAGIAALCLPIVWMASRKPGFTDHYPETRLDGSWSPARMRNNAWSWLVYLVGYELCFRGLLLFPVADLLGAPIALAWMTALYVLVHFNKNGQETAACLLMGFVFGGVALWAGSAWPAALAHWLIAMTGEGSAIARLRRGETP